LTGLAAELAGEDRAAVDAYTRLLHEHPGHPLAVMAKYKVSP
jgi:hypothetical protein